MLPGIGRPPEPNRIDTVNVPEVMGCMGLVACPGVRVEAPLTTGRKHLLADMRELEHWGANGVVCLVEPHELQINRIEALPQLVRDAGMWWKHLPIVDMDIPDQDFENVWAADGERIRHALRIGERVAFHCYAGLGRTGMIAARLLVEFGVSPERAIAEVRKSNPRRIQTRAQADFVRHCLPLV